MKSHTLHLTLNVPGKMAFVNITPEVAQAVRDSGVQEGLVLVNSMHITASVFVNDDERGLHRDFGVWLEELAPFNPDPATTTTTAPARTTPTRISNARSWAARSSWRSPRASSTSAPGSRSSTASSTAAGPSACW